ncbi:hypothetical protein [Ornithinimicrobium panacihumi]|uniref:hypothetical protein n=1 Tax=Ornithinimicrobium panacihumi TaxID=2008449 RepID=UPI003F898E6C
MVTAEPGEEFAWEVGAGWSRWGYRMRPVEGGTELVHEWAYLPAGQRFFGAKHGDRAQEQLALRVAAAREGIPRTLERIKAIVEAG